MKSGSSGFNKKARVKAGVYIDVAQCIFCDSALQFWDDY